MKLVIDDCSYFIQKFRGSYLSAISLFQGLIDGSGGKESICNAGDARHAGSLPMSGRSPWRRKWKPTPVFLLGKSHGRGAWWATVHGVTKSQAQLSNWARRHADMWIREWTREGMDGYGWQHDLGHHILWGSSNQDVTPQICHPRQVSIFLELRPWPLMVRNLQMKAVNISFGNSSLSWRIQGLPGCFGCFLTFRPGFFF